MLKYFTSVAGVEGLVETEMIDGGPLRSGRFDMTFVLNGEDRLVIFQEPVGVVDVANFIRNQGMVVRPILIVPAQEREELKDCSQRAGNMVGKYQLMGGVLIPR